MARKTKFECDGMADVIAKLGGIREESYRILKAALYEPAGILADEIRKHAKSHDRTGNLARSITIAQFKTNGGVVDTAVVFAGYDEKGVPNAVKAAALESGTSRGQKKTPFIAPAIKAARARMTAAMQEEFNKQVQNYWEDNK